LIGSLAGLTELEHYAVLL